MTDVPNVSDSRDVSGLWGFLPGAVDLVLEVKHVAVRGLWLL